MRLATDKSYFFSHFAHSWRYMVNNVHQSVQLHELKYKYDYEYETCEANNHYPQEKMYGYSPAYAGEM
jgi:hypothetical protein